MTKEDFKALRRGDIVQSILSGTSYVVAETHGTHAIVVRVLEIWSPDEWLLFSKSERKETDG